MIIHAFYRVLCMPTVPAGIFEFEHIHVIHVFVVRCDLFFKPLNAMWVLIQEQYDNTRSRVISRRQVPIVFQLLSTLVRWHDHIFPFMPLNPYTLSSEVDRMDNTRYVCERYKYVVATRNRAFRVHALPYPPGPHTPNPIL